MADKLHLRQEVPLPWHHHHARGWLYLERSQWREAFFDMTPIRGSGRRR